MPRKGGIVSISDLVKAFMKKHKIEWSIHYALPAPLGIFPLYPRLIHALRKEKLIVETRGCGTITISNNTGVMLSQFQGNSHGRKFSEFVARPALWVRPGLRIDSTRRTISCHVVIGAGDGRFFSDSIRAATWAIATVNPDCHELIRLAARSRMVSESWETLSSF